MLYRLSGWLVLLSSLLGGWLWMDYQQAVYAPLPLAQVGYFEIAKGEGVQRIAERLQAEGIIRSPLWFIWAARWRGVAGRLKYGEYEIRPGMTGEALLALLVSGKVRQHAVTLVEGRSFQQYRDVLAAHPALRHDGIDAAALMAALGAPGVAPEGYFYPDTYVFSKGTSETAVLRQAYGRMQAVLQEEWSRRAEGLPLANTYEALILASIVEKETALPAERGQIAGVFVRRLQANMRLQTDPSVIYGLGEHFDGNIHRRDLENDTPYNTYTRPGLPPTPIAMPGREAIHAALHPQPGNSLYFVAKGDGSHVFSDSLEAHQRAVVQYQLHPKAHQP